MHRGVQVDRKRDLVARLSRLATQIATNTEPLSAASPPALLHRLVGDASPPPPPPPRPALSGDARPKLCLDITDVEYRVVPCAESLAVRARVHSSGTCRTGRLSLIAIPLDGEMMVDGDDAEPHYARFEASLEAGHDCTLIACVSCPRSRVADVCTRDSDVMVSLSVLATAVNTDGDEFTGVVPCSQPLRVPISDFMAAEPARGPHLSASEELCMLAGMCCWQLRPRVAVCHMILPARQLRLCTKFT